MERSPRVRRASGDGASQAVAGAPTHRPLSSCWQWIGPPASDFRTSWDSRSFTATSLTRSASTRRDRIRNLFPATWRRFKNFFGGIPASTTRTAARPSHTRSRRSAVAARRILLSSTTQKSRFPSRSRAWRKTASQPGSTGPSSVRRRSLGSFPIRNQKSRN